jgi:hypothetical protein
MLNFDTAYGIQIHDQRGQAAGADEAESGRGLDYFRTSGGFAAIGLAVFAAYERRLPLESHRAGCGGDPDHSGEIVSQAVV